MSEKDIPPEEGDALVEEHTPSLVQEELDRLQEIEARWSEMQDCNEKLLRRQMDIIAQWVKWERERVQLFLHLRTQLQTTNRAVRDLLLDKETLLLRMNKLLDAVDQHQLHGIVGPDFVQQRKEET